MSQPQCLLFWSVYLSYPPTRSARPSASIVLTGSERVPPLWAAPARRFLAGLGPHGSFRILWGFWWGHTHTRLTHIHTSPRQTYVIRFTEYKSIVKKRDTSPAAQCARDFSQHSKTDAHSHQNCDVSFCRAESRVNSFSSCPSPFERCPLGSAGNRNWPVADVYIN